MAGSRQLQALVGRCGCNRFATSPQRTARPFCRPSPHQTSGPRYTRPQPQVRDYVSRHRGRGPQLRSERIGLGRAPRSCDALPGASALGRKHRVYVPSARPFVASRKLHHTSREPSVTLCANQLAAHRARIHANSDATRLALRGAYSTPQPSPGRASLDTRSLEIRGCCPSALHSAINANLYASQSPNGPGGQLQGRALGKRSLRAPAPTGVPAPIVAPTSPKGKTWSARP